MNVGHPIRTGLITIVIVATIAILLSPGSHYGPGAMRVDAQNTLSQLRAAMDAYKTEFGAYPIGSPEEIFHALYGQNPRRITFFAPNPKRTQSDGQLTDPWGTPYQIKTADREQLLLRSAGPNRRFDESPNGDDISER